MIDRVAIVTGGTGALGRVVVKKFASEGIKVYVPSLTLEEFNTVFDTSQNESEENFTLRKIFSFVCDAFDESSVKEFVRSVAALENGRIDYLVNTVGGIHPPVNIDSMDTKLFDKMFALNFKSAFFFTREALQVMKSAGFGRVVSIGAIAALEPAPGKFAYSAAKAAVINLMNTLSEELKEHNIRGNTVVPSIIDTPANREWGTEEDFKKWVKPEEIAGIISDLVSDKFAAVRGSIIKVYGEY